MMSRVSDERLVVAAVKGSDREAVKMLNTRIKSIIASQTLPQALQEEVREKILTQLHNYRFVGSFQKWVHTIARNASISYNRKPERKKSLPKVPPALNRPSIQAKLPPLEEIDLEIRSLVALLNELPHIRTTCSCSGHPNQEEWKTREWDPFGGWINIKPTGDPRAALEFLTTFLARLDNTAAVETVPGIRQEGDTSTDTIRRLYQQADAEGLFRSGGPVVIIGVYLNLFACHQEGAHRLQMWRQLIDSIRDLITDKEEICPEIDTPEMASRCLREELHRLPFIYRVELRTDGEGYPGLHLYTKADLVLCQWFLELANRIYLFQGKTAYWEAEAEGQAQFVAEWGFTLQPWLNAELIPMPHLMKYHWEPRTREDHLKIWKLIELAVEEQIH
ncbi:MAG: hypothetical protein OXU27_14880 [Candidatus Poribacteria bacterium]|nr:hypothetical protein [Candidatus Poribacteria bacterium]